MKTLSIFFALLLPTVNLFANTPAYKCQDNGKIVFSQTPCKSGTSTVVHIKPRSPSTEEQIAIEKAHKQRLKTIAQLEKIRERDDAKHEAINRKYANQAAANRKRCDAEQLKTKWAKEDLKNTQPRGEMKAQQKLKRSQERANLVCQN